MHLEHHPDKFWFIVSCGEPVLSFKDISVDSGGAPATSSPFVAKTQGEHSLIVQHQQQFLFACVLCLFLVNTLRQDLWFGIGLVLLVSSQQLAGVTRSPMSPPMAIVGVRSSLKPLLSC